MHPDRIAQLLAPFLAPEERSDQLAVLSPAQLQHISTYIDILLKWNAHMNLTAIRDPEDIVPRHFGESLFAARSLSPPDPDVETAALGCPPQRSSAAPSESAPAKSTSEEDARSGGRAALQGHVSGNEEMGASAPAPLTLADIGAGAGFPGLPIKLWAPHISLTLIESNHKKVTFLREVTRALTLTDVDIQNTRAESLTGTTFDVVTLRAVEKFETILPTAASLLAPAGRLALLIGVAQVEKARTTLPTLSWADPTPIPHSRARVLLTARRD